jgi:hypothetical protein
MLYDCLFCNLKFSIDFYYEQRSLSEQMRRRLLKEAASLIKKTVFIKCYLRSHKDRNPIYRMTFSKCFCLRVHVAQRCPDGKLIDHSSAV